MKVRLERIGPLRQAEFEIGDMTIICGDNNTGKTYATYTFYGFLMFWEEGFSINVQDETLKSLVHDGVVHLPIGKFVGNYRKILERASRRYTSSLSRVFASPEKRFEDAKVYVALDEEEIKPRDEYEQVFRTSKREIVSISKAPNTDHIEINLLTERPDQVIPRFVLKRAIGEAVKEIIFNRVFPRPFIASAERTGAAIFRKELDFARNRLLEQMSSMERQLDPFKLLDKVYSDYALPVRRNVDFTRQLEDIAKEESFISKQYPNLLTCFEDIIGGTYKIVRNSLYYIPQKGNVRLTMDESSSGVRSLLDIGFYLRHVAKPGDILMIDEPELNLHPCNQCRLVRLFVRLMNLGIKVFMTTHSDYIIKELNTLIMLNHDSPRLRRIMENEGYKSGELLSSDKVKVYIAEEALAMLPGGKRRTRLLTLVPADIDPEIGIEARSFDKTIEEMNRIQEEILFGKEE
ncbi:MAG: ATP-binding protein [Deltaproteobacteria bacterium]|nr:ATP-binding protein [Deltaproteobacteria bacterium]